MLRPSFFFLWTIFFFWSTFCEQVVRSSFSLPVLSSNLPNGSLNSIMKFKIIKKWSWQMVGIQIWKGNYCKINLSANSSTMPFEVIFSSFYTNALKMEPWKWEAQIKIQDAKLELPPLEHFLWSATSVTKLTWFQQIMP